LAAHFPDCVRNPASVGCAHQQGVSNEKASQAETTNPLAKHKSRPQNERPDCTKSDQCGRNYPVDANSRLFAVIHGKSIGLSLRESLESLHDIVQRFLNKVPLAVLRINQSQFTVRIILNRRHGIGVDKYRDAGGTCFKFYELHMEEFEPKSLENTSLSGNLKRSTINLRLGRNWRFWAYATVHRLNRFLVT
jgi:hypothetical protein